MAVGCCGAGEWMHWSSMVTEYTYPCDSIPEYSGILIPNVDNTRTTYLMDTIAKQQKVGGLYDER